MTATTPTATMQSDELLLKLHSVLGQQLPYAAPGWQTMAKTVRDVDVEKIEDRKDDIDTLLVFAGLYSAVLTAFLIESYKRLEPDTGDQIVFLLQKSLSQSYAINGNYLNSTSTFTAIPPPDIPPWALRVNGLWFASLVCSLASASIGMLVKQWLREYLAIEAISPRERLRARQYRTPALRTWNVFEIAAALPLLLHISLALFFVGLCFFTAAIDERIGNSTITLVCAWGFFVFITLVAPLFSPRCPFKITLMMSVMRTTRKVLVQPLRSMLGHERQPEEEEAIRKMEDDLVVLLSVDEVMGGDDGLLTIMWNVLKPSNPSAQVALEFVLGMIDHRIGTGAAKKVNSSQPTRPRSRPPMLSLDLRSLSKTACTTLMDIIVQILDEHCNDVEASVDPKWVLDAVHLLLSLSRHPTSLQSTHPIFTDETRLASIVKAISTADLGTSTAFGFVSMVLSHHDSSASDASVSFLRLLPGGDASGTTGSRKLHDALAASLRDIVLRTVERRPQELKSQPNAFDVVRLLLAPQSRNAFHPSMDAIASDDDKLLEILRIIFQMPDPIPDEAISIVVFGLKSRTNLPVDGTGPSAVLQWPVAGMDKEKLTQEVWDASLHVVFRTIRSHGGLGRQRPSQISGWLHNSLTLLLAQTTPYPFPRTFHSVTWDEVLLLFMLHIIPSSKEKSLEALDALTRAIQFPTVPTQISPDSQPSASSDSDSTLWQTLHSRVQSKRTWAALCRAACSALRGFEVSAGSMPELECARVADAALIFLACPQPISSSILRHIRPFLADITAPNGIDVPRRAARLLADRVKPTAQTPYQPLARRLASIAWDSEWISKSSCLDNVLGIYSALLRDQRPANSDDHLELPDSWPLWSVLRQRHELFKDEGAIAILNDLWTFLEISVTEYLESESPLVAISPDALADLGRTIVEIGLQDNEKKPHAIKLFGTYLGSTLAANSSTLADMVASIHDCARVLDMEDADTQDLVKTAFAQLYSRKGANIPSALSRWMKATTTDPHSVFIDWVRFCHAALRIYTAANAGTRKHSVMEVMNWSNFWDTLASTVQSYWQYLADHGPPSNSRRYWHDPWKNTDDVSQGWLLIEDEKVVEECFKMIRAWPPGKSPGSKMGDTAEGFFVPGGSRTESAADIFPDALLEALAHFIPQDSLFNLSGLLKRKAKSAVAEGSNAHDGASSATHEGMHGNRDHSIEKSEARDTEDQQGSVASHGPEEDNLGEQGQAKQGVDPGVDAAAGAASHEASGDPANAGIEGHRPDDADVESDQMHSAEAAEAATSGAADNPEGVEMKVHRPLENDEDGTPRPALNRGGDGSTRDHASDGSTRDHARTSDGAETSVEVADAGNPSVRHSEVPSSSDSAGLPDTSDPQDISERTKLTTKPASEEPISASGEGGGSAEHVDASGGAQREEITRGSADGGQKRMQESERRDGFTEERGGGEDCGSNTQGERLNSADSHSATASVEKERDENRENVRTRESDERNTQVEPSTRNGTFGDSTALESGPVVDDDNPGSGGNNAGLAS